MNQKIKALARQAGSIYDPVEATTVFNKEKFAELIIQECIDQCRSNAPELDQYSDEREEAIHFGVTECVLSIEQHFGVTQMNQQIKEIVDQSGFQPYYDAQQDQLEKLIKLLVQEFINICETEKDNCGKKRKACLIFEDKNIYAEGESASARIIAKTKQKFGLA